MTTTRFTTMLFVLVCAACGGTVEPGFEAPPAPQPDPVAPHNVCALDLPSADRLMLDCTTLADGGPSYLDEKDLDCRKYVEMSGEGCIPPMTCDAWIGGELVSGTCVARP